MELLTFIANIISMIAGMDTICTRIWKLVRWFHGKRKK